MTIALFAMLFFGSLAAGALGSALGMAGGIFVVPLMTLVAGVPFPVAVAVSLVSVIACSCASAPKFLSAGLTNLRLAEYSSRWGPSVAGLGASPLFVR